MLTLILSLLIQTSARAATLPAAAGVQGAVNNIEKNLLKHQYADGRWQGDFETTPISDALMLGYGRLLRIDTSAVRTDALKSISSQYNPALHGWAQWPGGPYDQTTTSQIVGALTYAGESSYLNQKGLARFPKMTKEQAVKLSWLVRMQLAPLGLIPDGAVPPVPMDMLKLQSKTAFRWPRLGVTGRGILAYGLWYNVDQAIRQNKVTEFSQNYAALITKTVDAITATEGRDGTWYFLTETLISVAALDALDRAGLQNLTKIPLRPTLDKAWAGLLNWRTKTQNGTINLQPMLSSTWDTALISVALSEDDRNRRSPALRNARNWLVRDQLIYSKDSPLFKDNGNGGWSFHQEDLAYPDVDDATAVLGSLMMIDHQSEDHENLLVFQNGLYWVLGHQNSDGGFPVFTKDVAKWPMELVSKFMPIENLYDDSSQPDITARVVIMLNHLLQDPSVNDRLDPYFKKADVQKAARRACRNLDNTSEQVAGAPLPLWHGDWFRNYLYGTSFVVQAYLRAPCDKKLSDVEPYLEWFLSLQNADGGWGEGTNTYASHSFSKGPSSLEMTAFAMLPLIDYLHTQAPHLSSDLSQRAYAAVNRGVSFFLKSTKQGTDFSDPNYLAVIFKDRWYGRYSYVSTYCMLHVLLNWQELQDEMQGKPTPPRL